MLPRVNLWRKAKSGIEVNVRVVPRSSKDAIVGVDETHNGRPRGVRVRAVPDRGEANQSVVRIVADWLGVLLTSVAAVAEAASGKASPLLEPSSS
jgi:uncharacterized protein